jgi:hypothetical protein
MQKKRDQIVVVVSGGVLRSVYSTRKDLHVMLVDCDDLAADNFDEEGIDAVIKGKATGLTLVF